MDYDVEYFLAKFEAIPEDQWTINNYLDANGRSCAYGHCGVRDLEQYTEEAEALYRIAKPYFREWGGITFVNDGYHPFVDDAQDIILARWGNTPKTRVVNFLRWIRDNRS